ncbi:MAG: formate dehydrogenase subunit delta [Halieaceae bacterium]|nr:formate dehydrogenase subunit delta [Halieaceae bacterium]
MTDAQLQHLVKMAQQIALNMAAEGDAQAARTAAHINRFWTPAMRQQFLEHAQTHADDLSPVMRDVVEILAASQ